MALTRVTVTLAGDLVRAADRAARRLGGSRSRIVAKALRAFLEPSPGRVAEEAHVAYAPENLGALAAASDEALLAELRNRLAKGDRAPQPLATSGAGNAAGPPRISFERQRLAELCLRHHIRRLCLFGSVLTDDFRPDSDVDVLVEFEPGKTPGFAIMDVEDELSALFGRRVDLVTPNSLHRLFRDRVLASAVVQYAA